MKKVQLRGPHHCVYNLHFHLVLVSKSRRRSSSYSDQEIHRKSRERSLIQSPMASHEQSKLAKANAMIRNAK